MSDKIIHITSKQEHDALLSADKNQHYVSGSDESVNIGNVLTSYKIIDFHASWCGPCHMIAPVYETLANENPNIKFAKVDVDAVPDVAQHYGIRAMPTFIVTKYNEEGNLEEVDQLRGANPQALADLVQKTNVLQSGAA
ncbi:thioredoxin-like protein [Rhizoctonia solani]|nr:thioredoxin-like protein [Rhizoctonia solani]